MTNVFGNCEETMETFYSLDKGARMPVKTTLHLLFCKKCRSKVRLLTRAENSLDAIFPQEPISAGDLAKIMQKIDDKSSAAQPVSFANWMFGWLALFASIFIYKFSSGTIPPEISLPVYATWGIIFTAYCAVFVDCNFDFFVKKSHILNAGN